MNAYLNIKSSRIIAVVAAVVLSGLFGCNTAEPQAEETTVYSNTSLDVHLTAEQMKNGNIQVAVPAVENISQTLLLNGRVDVPPDNLVSVTCPMGGYINSIKVYTGQSVSRGEVLLTMSDPSYIQMQQDYLVSRSKLTYLQQEYQRQKALSETQASSLKAYQQVASEMQVEQVNMSALRQKLSMIGINANRLSAGNIITQIAIRSPINGFVTSTPVNMKYA